MRREGKIVTTRASCEMTWNFICWPQRRASPEMVPGVQFFFTSLLPQSPDNMVSGRVDTCHFYLVVFQLSLYAAASKNKDTTAEGYAGLFEDLILFTFSIFWQYLSPPE